MNKFALYSLALLMLCACQDKKQADKSKEEVLKTPVKVITLEKKDIAKTLEYNANLEADKVVHYAPSSPGRINKIYVEVGDNIRKGQLLVEMDKTSLIQAEVQYRNAEADYNRGVMLDKTGSISKQNLDGLQTAFEVAKANYEFLKENTKLLAPFDGVVTAKYYENGEMYMSSPVGGSGKAAIISIEKINPIKAYVELTESFYNSIKAGTKIGLRSELFPDETFDGQVKIKYPTIDPSTRTFTVELTIPNGDKRLRPGMFGKVDFFIGQTNSLVIPSLAVLKLQGSNDRYLFLVEDGKAKRVSVELGRRFEDQVEVLSDQIKEGAQLVVVGQGRLRDGMEVSIEEVQR